MVDSTERLGALLVKKGALTLHQFTEVLEYQKQHPELRFGAIATKKEFITTEILEKYL